MASRHASGAGHRVNNGRPPELRTVESAFETSIAQITNLLNDTRGRILPNGWQPPDDLSETEWRAIGNKFGHAERSLLWVIGDWWNAYKPEWGARADFFKDRWQGPAHQTCVNASNVSKRFDFNRRRLNLTFAHHAEVAALPPAEADELLDWAEAPIATTSKPRSTRELRSEVSRRRNRIGEAPSAATSVIENLFDAAKAGLKFGCIYADPPWLYDNQGTRAATGNHYEGLTVDELCALPIRELAADDAHLHLWITNGFLFEAPKIFEAWGFEFRSTFAWCKPQIGIGNYWRNAHEILLTGVRGDAKRFNDHSMRSWFECERGRHSEKPEQVRAMLERASPGPRLELFARWKAPGWSAWGNEVQQTLVSGMEATP
jgi:N6-adenosine-specific RNA methylase IME4